MRAAAVEHCRECVEIAKQAGSPRSASGSPTGRTTRARTTCAAARAPDAKGWSRCTRRCRPGCGCWSSTSSSSRRFYCTDLPDWGTAALVCRRLGPQAQVLVDTGHHPQGTNIEQIVAVLLAEGLLGGFHFNNRKYADDDLIVGSVDPFELFRIMREIALARHAEDVAFMIDQSHNIEGKIDAMIQSVDEHPDRLREGAARGRGALAAAQAEGDVLGAHRILLEAFETDVRPLLARLRSELGVAPTRSRRSAPAATRSASRRSAARRRSRARTSAHDAAQRLRPSREARPDRRLRRGAPEVWPDMLQRCATPASGTTRSSGTAARCSATSSPTISSGQLRTWRSRRCAPAGRTRWPAAGRARAGRGPAGARGDLPTRLTHRVSAMPTVQLFATCLGDLVVRRRGRRRGGAAAAGRASRSSSRERQVCCGQPAFNAGSPRRRPARRTLVRARLLA